MNPLKQLLQQGQSIWLDSISRDLIKSGELQRLVTEDGLRGLTSNPTIFEQAIGHGSEYDDALRQLLRANEKQPEKALFEALAVEDIRMVFASVAPYTLRAVQTENLIRGRHLTPEVIEEAAKAIQDFNDYFPGAFSCRKVCLNKMAVGGFFRNGARSNDDGRAATLKAIRDGFPCALGAASDEDSFTRKVVHDVPAP